jgi:hypothetical protein
MEQNKRRQEDRDQLSDRQKEGQINPGLAGTTRINKSVDDLDEKSSTAGSPQRSRTGLSSKDGLTGSDLDGQVTR